MTQLASSAASSATTSSSSTSTSSTKTEIQTLLGQFDAQINTMMDYPAKDTINALTMLAERAQCAPEIVSFLETKIHRVAPNCKLPIFYLTDSILKNVRGPYIPLFAAKIVPLYCNCVRQVSEKDLKRFIHVLNTWESTHLFHQDAILQMRMAANHVLHATSGTSSHKPLQGAPSSSAQEKRVHQQQDMELRSLLTKLQNDMGIHPTEHMSLEEVRTKNPSYYKQLLAFQAAGGESSHDSEARNPPRRQSQEKVTSQAFRPPCDPRTGRPPVPSQALHGARPRPSSAIPTSTKSANVAHLMQLLKRKQRLPSPPQPSQETPMAPSRAPDAAAVMSILQKLKGLASKSEPSRPVEGIPQVPQVDPTSVRSDHASRMWFSDQIVAHKERVESNVQKLYAALPLVCRESGVRFREQAHLNAHLDFLFQFNRARKARGKGGVSRSWYPDVDPWVVDFSGDTAPRESTSSSFFDQSTPEKQGLNDQASWEQARVPVDEAITRCRICGENFTKSWDEDEEDWMYTNAVAGTIHDTSGHGMETQETIFHKYCYDTVMMNSKQITSAHLIPAERDVAAKMVTSDGEKDGNGELKRTLNEDDSDSDGDDVKRVKVA